MRIGQRVMLIAALPAYGYPVPPIGKVGVIEGFEDIDIFGRPVKVIDYMVRFDDWSPLLELCPAWSIVPIDEAKEDHSQQATLVVEQ